MESPDIKLEHLEIQKSSQVCPHWFLSAVSAPFLVPSHFCGWPSHLPISSSQTPGGHFIFSPILTPLSFSLTMCCGSEPMTTLFPLFRPLATPAYLATLLTGSLESSLPREPVQWPFWAQILLCQSTALTSCRSCPVPYSSTLPPASPAPST